MSESREPRNLLEAIRYFSDEQVAFDFVVKLRWPTGEPTCPRCGCLDNYYLSTRHIWKCSACKRQFSVRVGTIFEDSPLPFSKWLPAFWLLANSKNGVSSHELGRALGITQKSAWFVLNRIRLAMRTGTFEKMTGEVEVDETFVGGLAKFMHKAQRAKLTGTGPIDKTIVVGALERTTEDKASRVHAEVTPDRTASTLQAVISAAVVPGSTVYTDAHVGYNHLSDRNYAHSVIDHAIAYVDERVHTQGIESFWNLMKRSLKGTYTHVAPEQLGRYLDERCFTFNERELTDAERMRSAVARVAGRRLTYAELTGHN
jgi:transposase-like protein